MEPDIKIDFVWLPSEKELPGVISFLESKENGSFSKNKQLASLKSFLSKLFDLRIQILDFKQKSISGGSNGIDSLNKDKAQLYRFYAMYLYRISCAVLNNRKCDTEEYKRLIKLFCSQSHLNSPKLWLSIDTSNFVGFHAQSYFINTKKFSLGNIVGLNQFVEHFNSDTSLLQHNYKITQVKVKLLHDSQMMHVYFVVGNSKVSVKKRGPRTHQMHRLAIPYSSIHTILICSDESFTAYFRLYKSPLLYAVEQNEEYENYLSYSELTPYSVWNRTINLFNGCPPSIRKEFGMNSVVQLDFSSDNYEILKIRNYQKSVQIYFSPVSIVPYKQVPLSFQFKSFDCHYGFYCLLTHSYEICDYLMDRDEMSIFRKFIADKCTENPKAISEAFYVIFSAISQCNVIFFNHALKDLYERLSKTEMDDENKNSNLLKVKKAIVVPTHIRFIPPQVVLKNKALRDCNPDYSLRVNIRDVNLDCLNFIFNGVEKQVLMKKFLDVYLKKPMLDGIKIEKRRYQYVGCSTNELRSHGLWFYAEDENNKTAEILRNAFGNKDKLVQDYMACINHAFSQSHGNVRIPQRYTNIRNPKDDLIGGKKKYLIDSDIEDSLKRMSDLEISRIPKLSTASKSTAAIGDPYIFSDGIGQMSREIAEQVYQKLGLEDSRPCAMQICYAGCKGVLVVNPNLDGKEIAFRKSMKKFSSESDSLEILKYSKKRTTSLNRTLIIILEQLGVSKKVFMELEELMIRSYIRSMFNEADACNFLNRNSQLSFNFMDVYKAGFSISGDPLFRSMIYGLFRKQFDLLTKGNIEILPNEGRSMFGVLDETFTLEYGQVFIQYTDWYTERPIVFKGPVVVTKNPCMHPGDVRKFEAVDVKDLHHIHDCIVFPAKGKRPHPDEMGGSYLDGDEYEVLFHEEFVFPRENYEAMDYAVPEANMEETWKNMNLEPADELDHVCNYIINDDMELIAEAHLVFADKEKEGIFNENCLRLAKKYALALSFPKTAVSVLLKVEDRVCVYPDFIQKSAECATYASKKVLGILYRHCKKLEMGLEISSTSTEYREDPDLEYEKWQEYQRKALKMYKNYCKKVENLINVYSFNNEGELLAGAIINPPKYYEQRHDLENLKALLEYEIQWIFSNLEKQFFDEFGGKPTDRNYTSKMYQKASAWYIVTYRDIPGKTCQYFGFPWAVSDVLMKLKSDRCSHRGYPVANVKSLLEETVDESLKKYMPTLSDETHAIHENRLEIMDIACNILTQWLKTLGDLLQLDRMKFELLLCEEFALVSDRLAKCNEQYIDHLKETNNLKQAISPGYLIIETLLRIANIKVSDAKILFTDSCYELGLLSWITLIKLVCSYNPKYLSIPSNDGNSAIGLSCITEDVISIVTLYAFKEETDEYHSKLHQNSVEIVSYLKEVYKLKELDICMKFGYDAMFTVKGTRYAIEKLKDLIMSDDFYEWVVKGKDLGLLV